MSTPERRAEAQWVADELARYLCERNIELAEALLFTKRLIIHEALEMFATTEISAVWLQAVSNATMRPERLEKISPEASRTLLIGIARDAQTATGLSADQAEDIIDKAEGAS